jgi:hAT family C-terminal dimerisation region
MASSVSSERAFSQGGITVTKRRNRLKGDIVEALQCVKCCIQHDLLFREPPPSSALETELDGESEDGEEPEAVEDESWDSILLDDEEDDEMADDESDF